MTLIVTPTTEVPVADTNAFALIMADVALYVDPKRPLCDAEQRAIAKLLGEFPALNTEENVDYLVNLAAFYGINSKQLKKLTESFVTLSPRIVHLATAYLYEFGERGGAGDSKAAHGLSWVNHMSRLDWVIKAAGFIARAETATAQQFDDTEALASFVTDIGGLRAAYHLYEDEIVAEINRAPIFTEGMSHADREADRDWD